MSILQRYFAVNIGKAVLFVLLAFLALVAFLDLTYVLPQVGKNDFGIQHAFMYVLLLVPGNVNTVLPVAALIGTIYTMAQFASSSEFTIMRASSMSTRRAALMLAKVGIGIVAIAFLFGELITPQTAPIAERLRLTAKGGSVSGEFRSGMWTKDSVHEGGVRGKIIGTRFFNVRHIAADGKLEDVRLYEFDNNMRMRSIVTAEHGVYDGNNAWRLSGVTETRFGNSRELPAPGAALPAGQSIQQTYGHETASVSTRKLDSYELPSEITPRILSVSRSDPERMSAVELAVYTRHLAENRQETDRFKVAFWKKIFDPLSIMVLMALALPFAYLHTRSGGVSLKIFIGIMIGVSFLLINSLFSHLGVLTILPPLLTAVAPSALFLLLAVGALWWVERH